LPCDPSALNLKMPPAYARKATLAIGQEIETRVDDLLEEFWTVDIRGI